MEKKTVDNNKTFSSGVIKRIFETSDNNRQKPKAYKASKKNIREITLFPMNQNAQDLMMKAPSEVDQKQLKELSLKIDKKKN